MKYIKYWWRHFIWRPLDIADRILVLVGAISAYLKQVDNPITINLAWQIPLGAIIVFLVWRFIQLPLRIIDDIRRASTGENFPTVEGIDERVKKVEKDIRDLQERVEPQCTFDIHDIKEKIFLNYQGFDQSMIGGITRAIVFSFEVTNASPLYINVTGKTKGDLIVLAWRLTGVHWQITCDEIEPGKKRGLNIIFPVSENFARTLAFKPIDGNFYAEFSEMFVEFEAKDNNQRQTLGYIPIGKNIEIPIKDHPAYQKIRKIVEWEEQLGVDKRIS